MCGIHLFVHRTQWPSMLCAKTLPTDHAEQVPNYARGKPLVLAWLSKSMRSLKVAFYSLLRKSFSFVRYPNFKDIRENIRLRLKGALRASETKVKTSIRPTVKSLIVIFGWIESTRIPTQLYFNTMKR